MKIIIVLAALSFSFCGYSQETPELSEKGTIKKEVDIFLKEEAQPAEVLKLDSNPKKRRKGKTKVIKTDAKDKELIELMPEDKEN